MKENDNKLYLKYYDKILAVGESTSAGMFEFACDFELVDLAVFENSFMRQVKDHIYQKPINWIIHKFINRGFYIVGSNGIIIQGNIGFYGNSLSDTKRIKVDGSRKRWIFKTLDIKEEFFFFYETKHPFSQWYKSEFEVSGRKFSSAEQYMMFEKSRFFNDYESADLIMKTRDPRKQKSIGRQVKGFDLEKWNSYAPDIVYEGNFAKFTQNPILKEALIATKGSTLVEASPYDTIWGIGLDHNSSEAAEVTTWKGTNWLGICLTEVREDIINDSYEDHSNRDLHFYYSNQDLDEKVEKLRVRKK